MKNILLPIIFCTCSLYASAKENISEKTSPKHRIEANTNNETGVWLEAECASTLGDKWQKLSSSSASSGSYISIKDGHNSTGSAPSASQDIASFSFNTATAGSHKLYGRIMAESGGDNSFYVRINGGSWNQWSVKPQSGFVWHSYSDPVELKAGTNTIEVSYREDGTLLDKFFISMDGSTPSGTGSAAINCGGESIRNEAPKVSISGLQNLTLPTNSTSLTAQASDADGSISSYKWEQVNGPTQAKLSNTSSATAKVDGLQEGSYTFKVTVTDDQQATASEQLQLTVEGESEAVEAPADETGVWLEAECASTLGDKWQRLSGSSASSGSYISIKDGHNSTSSAPSASQDIASFSFNTATAGSHKLFGRIMAESGGDNSFYVRINGGSWDQWSVKPQSGFVWHSYSDPVELKAGTNTIEVSYREDGTLLDKFFISMDGSTPSGTGSAAINCGDVEIGNLSPSVDAGDNKTLTLPDNSITLKAQASDADGSISSYKWEQVNGPTQAKLSNASTASVKINELKEGKYTFKVTVTDNEKATASDQLQLTVEAEAVEAPADEVSDIVIKNTINLTSDKKINNNWLIGSHTRITSSNGAVIKIDGSRIQGGLVLNGVTDVIIENVTIDINAERNFVTGIWLEETRNVIIRNCRFINSKKSIADPDWTLHGINARNIKFIKVLNNYSDNCQLKLNGGNYSAEDVVISDNYIREVTQMGISVVAQPTSGRVVMRNITIERNTMEKIDNHGIYVGVDHGKGEYGAPTIVENIVIVDNNMNEMAFLNSSQRSKGILVNGTKESKNIRIENNKVSTPTNFDKQIMGIQIKCTDGGHTKNLKISGNEVSGLSSFGIYLEGTSGLDISDNYFKEGRGIVIKSSADGEVYDNYFTNTNGQVRIESSSDVTAE
ncbi:parallel beta-helix repeat protein [Catalinimonas alkaloidigena]|uniref:PKD domain-containing protein n=1 Tax=Catalinimonas alkaloidigena TaxID=1075417 RepID=UPI0024072CB8|nr:right-handed parallel beta-helix repeat-containing protein [Catalinimonas alkaloidigena]MDF9799701.1 parallel beta-helix repeat protein [Catalinimonas alkaloidigena]